MAFAAPSKNKLQSTNLAKSSWTPMNNSDANLQVFDERKALINKWFEKWNEKQKHIVVNEIVKKLSDKHLFSLCESLKQKFPQEKFDFTLRLPRVLTLYVLSFLDPKSLCRCAQVSWYWKYLSEMDCVWRPKCLKFGWYPTNPVSPHEEAVWKRFYVSTIYELNYTKAKKETPEDKTAHETIPDSARSIKSRMSSARSYASNASGIRRGPQIAHTKKPLPKPKWEPPPWKGSDRNPTDTMRYNYLDNSEKSRIRKSHHGTEGKENRKSISGRPQSASGSLMASPRVGTPTGHHQPQKSHGSPVIKGSLSMAKTDVSQSVESPKQRQILQMSSRNMMSASLTKFSSENDTLLAKQEPTKPVYNLDGTIANGTLEASTYHINIGEKTLKNTGSLNSSPTIQHDFDTNALSIKDAGIRPKPVIKSPDKVVESGGEANIRNIVKSSEYQSKNISDIGSGKATPLHGSPWKTIENNSDDD